MIHGNWLVDRPYSSAALVFIVLFASPVAMALSAGQFVHSARIKSLLSAFGFKVDRFIPTAWDFKFSQETPCWVIVRLRDGSSVYGFLGAQSFAGDESSERDLYVEAIFTPSADGHWQPIADTLGILIKAGEIATIEFRRLETSFAKQGD